MLLDLLDRVRALVRPSDNDATADLKAEVAAVRTDAEVDYRLRREAEIQLEKLQAENDQLKTSNRVLQVARDDNSTLITKLRDRIFELEARFDWTPKHCDLCNNTHTLDGVVIWCGPKRSAHLTCITRLVEGALAGRGFRPATPEDAIEVTVAEGEDACSDSILTPD